MNILIQHDPRSIAIRGAGPDPFALIFRHASRSEDSGDRCVVEFLPWKDVQQRTGYKLLNSVEVYGSLGLIDIEEGTHFQCRAIDHQIFLFVLSQGKLGLQPSDLERRWIGFMLSSSTL